MDDLVLAQNGDEQAFERLINMMKFKLYKTAMSILKNDNDTCDALQETLISAYANLKNLNDIKQFSSWIIRILINKCYDILRKNKKISYINQKLQIEDVGFYERYKIESELESILVKIDEDLKIVVVLYYYDDLSIMEIANILNIPEGTVKSRLSRARKKLCLILKRKEEKSNG